MRKSAREKYIQGIVDEVSEHIANAGIKAKVDGRVKHFFSIYKKMKNQSKTLDQIYDLFAVRIIVDSLKDCYAALGVIHEMYTPIPGRFIRKQVQIVFQQLHKLPVVGHIPLPLQNLAQPHQLFLLTAFHLFAVRGLLILVTIDYEIKNGDRIEIITSQNSKGPSRDWLNVVKSTQAKNKINQWFKEASLYFQCAAIPYSAALCISKVRIWISKGWPELPMSVV